MQRYNSMDVPARGTVAQVLAQARASLKDPSRPFTPAETRRENYSDSRPSSVQENRKIFSNFENEMLPGRKSRKGPRDALSRGSSRGSFRETTMPSESSPRSSSCLIRSSSLASSSNSFSNSLSTSPRGKSDNRPAWIKEMDEIIVKLDVVMTDLTSQVIVNDGNNDKNVIMVRELLSQLWPCVESMAAACSDGDERWILQRNRLFASLFRVLERRESDLRLCAARCVLSLLGAGRASMSVSLQLPKYETAVCKVLFQLTKVSRNDDAFFDVGAVEPMLTLLEAQSHQLNNIGPSNSTSTLNNVKVIVPLEAPVHLVGALKNISSSTEAAQTRLGKLGAISVLCSLLRHCLSEINRSKSYQNTNKKEEEDEENKNQNKKNIKGSAARAGVTDNETEKQILRVQLLTNITGTLRNLSLTKTHHKQLASCGAPALLCELVGCMMDQPELMFNITRVLAKLSLHESMRSGINSNTQYALNLLNLLTSTASRTLKIDFKLSSSSSSLAASSSIALSPTAGTSQMIALLVRVSFTLGNLTASNEKNRILLGRSGGPILVQLLESTFDRYYELYKNGDTLLSSEYEELLVKLIRLLANLSISNEIGPMLSELKGIAILVPLLEHVTGKKKQEELLLNVVSAITNLSFYYQPKQYHQYINEEDVKENEKEVKDEMNFLLNDYSRLCVCLVEILLHENNEAVTEAARAFGNISRDYDVRGCMLACGAGEALVILLDHSSRDVVFAASGALVNIGADVNCNDCLTSYPEQVLDISPSSSLNGCCKLVHVLRKAGLRDLPMAAVAAKALYNVLASFTTSTSTSQFNGFQTIAKVLGRSQLEFLHETLDELVDVIGEDGMSSFTRPASALLHLITRVIEFTRINASNKESNVLQFDDVYEDLPYSQSSQEEELTMKEESNYSRK